MNELIQQLANIDAELMLFLNSMHSSFFDYFMKSISGKWIWIPFYAATLYAIVRRFGFKIALLSTLAITLTIVLTDQIGASVIRPAVERLRPSNPLNPISQSIHLVNGYRGGSYGFPSCHAANTFGLAFFITFLIKKHAVTWLYICWATIVCYSRIYLGVHYPGDILAGCLLAFATVCVTYPLFLLLKHLCSDEETGNEQRPHTLLLTSTALLMTITYASTYALLKLYMA